MVILGLQYSDMQRSKLFRILQGFTQSDWKGFDKFLLMQHSKHADLYRLFKYISKSSNNLDARRLNIDVTQSKIEPNIPRKSFQNIMSRLVKEIEQYFVWEQIQSDEENTTLNLLEAYNKRGLYKDFDGLAQKLRNKYSNNEELSIWRDYNMLKINYLQFFSQNPIKYKSGEKLLTDSILSLSGLATNLTQLLKATQYHFGNIINRELWNTHHQRETNDKNPTSLWIKAIYNASKNRDKIHYEQLRDLFLSQKEKGDLVLLSSALVCLVNIASHIINAGGEINPTDLLKIHLGGLQKGLYTTSGRLSAMRLYNIVNVAASCGQYETAKEIINKYSPMIIRSERDQAIALSLSEIELYQSKYDKAIDLIRDMTFTSTILSLSQRISLLKCYYLIEPEDVDFFNAAAKNFNAFIHNNKAKISSRNFEACLKLSKILKRSYGQEDVQQIIEELKHNSTIHSRIWLKQILQNKTDQST